MDEETRLAAWLAALPKPCGVMAAFDARAKQVLDVCRDADIDVPGQIQICGVDLARDLLERTATPISEIAPLCGLESAGHLKVLFRRRFGCTMSDWRCKKMDFAL